MDSELRTLSRSFRSGDISLLRPYFRATQRAGVVPIEFLVTAIRLIDSHLNRQYFNLFYPPERQRGLINNLDFRTPASTAESIERFARDVAFHLSPCICNAPTWQQPCPFCHYWPDYGMRPAERNQYDNRFRNTMTFDRFANIMSRHEDNFALFWARQKAVRAVASWQGQATFLSERASEMARELSWPSPKEIWDAYQRIPCQECDLPAINTAMLRPEDLEINIRTDIYYPIPFCREHAGHYGYRANFGVLSWPPV